MRVPTCRRRHADADADMTTRNCVLLCRGSDPTPPPQLYLNTPGRRGGGTKLPSAWGIHLCTGKWFYTTTYFSLLHSPHQQLSLNFKVRIPNDD